ncbi:unnamed protein product [Echinostoma caproni]|uniref:BHLH domain-containing protein n=1 Tax=Echinostoma caproni TaxID=27848 RepID=A0A183A9U9_9TREM|nr:unnamed protein product [Echinostoma caproni]
MYHFTRPTCLEAAIGDIIRQANCSEENDDHIDNEEEEIDRHNPESITQAYFYKNFPVHQSDVPAECNTSRPSGMDEDEMHRSSHLAPRFPSPNCLWNVLDDSALTTSDTWLYETLYSNAKWNNTPHTVNRSNLDTQTDQINLPEAHWSPSAQYPHGLSRADDARIPKSDTAIHLDMGRCEAAYAVASRKTLDDTGDTSNRGFTYSTPFRQRPTDSGAGDQFDFTPESVGGDCRPQSGTYIRERIPTRKQHQRVQDKIRTRALNAAFGQLRSCLPEIPKDTKLTKIRTLRTAITYIRQLMSVLNREESGNTHPRATTTTSTSSDSTSRTTAFLRTARLELLKSQSSCDDSTLRDSGYDSMFDKY